MPDPRPARRDEVLQGKQHGPAGADRVQRKLEPAAFAQRPCMHGVRRRSLSIVAAWPLAEYGAVIGERQEQALGLQGAAARGSLRGPDADRRLCPHAPARAGDGIVHVHTFPSSHAVPYGFADGAVQAASMGLHTPGSRQCPMSPPHDARDPPTQRPAAQLASTVTRRHRRTACRRRCHRTARRPRYSGRSRKVARRYHRSAARSRRRSA